MITKECCKGVIAFLPTVFTADWQIDEQKNRENVRRLVEEGVHCIQSTGGAGEFYALDHKQHECMARIVAEEANGKVYTIAGCGAFSTEDAIARAKIAQHYGIDAAIFVTPFYFGTILSEVVKFFDDIARACPNIGLVHFNTPTSKIVLTGRDYGELQKVTNVIGSKQGGNTHVTQWYDIQLNAPDMVHFVTDDILLSAMMYGCQGVDSIMAATRPDLVMRTYDLCCQRRWEEALKLQELMWQLSMTTNCLPSLEGRYSDCAVDKAVIDAAGFLHAGDPKPPYIPLSPEDMQALRDSFARFDAMMESTDALALQAK